MQQAHSLHPYPLSFSLYNGGAAVIGVGLNPSFLHFLQDGYPRLPIPRSLYLRRELHGHMLRGPVLLFIMPGPALRGVFLTGPHRAVFGCFDLFFATGHVTSSKPFYRET